MKLDRSSTRRWLAMNLKHLCNVIRIYFRWPREGKSESIMLNFLFQVDSLALEELPLRRGARGLPQRLKTQAGKLRSRLRNIQRPTFAFTERQKPEKARSTSSGRSDRSRSEKRPSRMDRIRSSLSERPRFSLPNRPRFSLPDKSRFHLPERPRFNFPERTKFHLPEKAKFSIKKPNIRLPNALTRKKSPVHEQRSIIIA